MIELENFLEEDFDRLIAWVESEEELIQFAGPIFSYPLTHEQLTTYINQGNRRVFKVRLASSGEIIGHCEINFQNPMPRLSRILIGNKGYRNKGIGKHIVRKMLDMVFLTTPFDGVDLNVFDWNMNAINSYKKVGFQIKVGLETEMAVGTKIWKACNMIIRRDEYLEQ